MGTGAYPLPVDVADETHGRVRADPLVTTHAGRSYLRGRSAVPEAMVAAAYRQLQRETDRLFIGLFDNHAADATRVAFTRCHRPYASDHELIAAVRSERTLEITSASVAAGRTHPRMSGELGGALDRFRAVHDFIGHVMLGSGFDLDGECAAWLAQDRLHTGLARWALATEILGVNSARWVGGEAPELRAMLLDPRLLDRWHFRPQGQGRVPGDDRPRMVPRRAGARLPRFE
jgi:hypothetical protein